jgi:hypothetical protein
LEVGICASGWAMILELLVGMFALFVGAFCFGGLGSSGERHLIYTSSLKRDRRRATSCGDGVLLAACETTTWGSCLSCCCKPCVTFPCASWPPTSRVALSISVLWEESAEVSAIAIETQWSRPSLCESGTSKAISSVVIAGYEDGCGVSCRVTASTLSSYSGEVTSRGCVTSTASAYTVMSAPANPSFVLVAAASRLVGWRLVVDGPQSSPASRIMGSEAFAPMSMPRCALVQIQNYAGPRGQRPPW